jgi:hypothetical protein
MLDVVRDVAVEVRVEALLLPHHRLLVVGDRLQDVVDEAPEQLVVLGREPEHAGDDGGRDVLRVVDRGIARVGVADPVEQVAAQLPGDRLQGLDRPGSEGRQQQAAGEGVERRVRRDRRRAADRRLGLGLDLGHHDAPAGEVVGVVGDGRDVGVARRQPDPAVPIRVGDRAARPQVVPYRERVADPGGVRMVEVGGEVGHGWPGRAGHGVTPRR